MFKAITTFALSCGIGGLGLFFTAFGVINMIGAYVKMCKA